MSSKEKAMRKSAMVWLFAVVLVAGCVPAPMYQQQVQKSQLYEELNQQLQAEVAADQVKIQQLQDRLKVTMLNEILFPEGGWEIGQKGKQTLNKMVPVLKSLQNKRIEVSGYTDNVPIAPAFRWRFPSNWELSTARATDVLRYLVQQGVNPSVLSATGYGEQNPVASNDTPAGRSQNRRVEIVIAAMNP
jgi:chemotaxis protein MotB